MARDVFISYSQPDQEIALEMVARIEERGISCWIAPRDIAPSSDWAAEIIDAISNARIMVLVFSANSNGSPQVRREVERAVHKGITILPFRIENVLPSKSLEYFLSAQHWMDAFSLPREPHYARLCEHLKKMRSAVTPATTSPSTTSPAAPSSAVPSPAPPRPAPAVLFDGAELRQIERQLAGFIGPVAKHLVKTAVSQAAGIDDLVARLSMELDTETDRRGFAHACRAARPRA
jgi:TIR domain